MLLFHTRRLQVGHSMAALVHPKQERRSCGNCKSSEPFKGLVSNGFASKTFLKPLAYSKRLSRLLLILLEITLSSSSKSGFCHCLRALSITSSVSNILSASASSTKTDSGVSCKK